MSTSEDLPSVAGRMEMSHADFQRDCLHELEYMMQIPARNTDLVRLLCEAVRCSRECCEEINAYSQLDDRFRAYRQTHP